jgi:hypothetical protein
MKTGGRGPKSPLRLHFPLLAQRVTSREFWTACGMSGGGQRPILEGTPCQSGSCPSGIMGPPPRDQEKQMDAPSARSKAGHALSRMSRKKV